VRQVWELIALERLCCSLPTFVTRIETASDRLVLELTGGEGARAFIAAQAGGVAGFSPKEAP